MNILDFLSSPGGRVVRVVLGLAMVVIGVVLGGGWWALAIVGSSRSPPACSTSA